MKERESMPRVDVAPHYTGESVPYVDVTPDYAETLVKSMNLTHLNKKYAKAAAEISDRLKRDGVDKTEGLVKIDESGTIVKGMEYLLGVMNSQMTLPMKIERGVKMNAFMNMELRNTVAENAQYLNPDININWPKIVAAVNVLALFAGNKIPADIIIDVIKAHKALIDQCTRYFTPYPGIDGALFRAAALLYLYDATNDEVRERLTRWCQYIGEGNIDNKVEADAKTLAKTTRREIYQQSGQFSMLKRKTKENKKRAVIQLLISMNTYGYAHTKSGNTEYNDVVEGISKDVKNFFGVAGVGASTQTVTPKDIRGMILSLNKADEAAKQDEATTAPAEPSKEKKAQSARTAKATATSGKTQKAKPGRTKGTSAVVKKVTGTTRARKKENPAA